MCVTSKSWLVFLVVLGAVLANGRSSAELPLIRFDRLVPIGASAGTTVQVEQAGGDTDGVTEMIFDHPGIKSEHVKDNRVFKLTIGSSATALADTIEAIVMAPRSKYREVKTECLAHFMRASSTVPLAT